MSRLHTLASATLRRVACLSLAAGLVASSASAQQNAILPTTPPVDVTAAQPSQPVQQTGYAIGMTMGLPAAGGNALPSIPYPGYGPQIPGRRPVSQAPLYPSPIQSTPPWNGGTVITNQALAPHEMLYPHEYRAMYGPYFYEVRGHTLWTPIGMRTFENWKLRGTEVEVKYHDHFKLFSGFHPPRGH